MTTGMLVQPVRATQTARGGQPYRVRLSIYEGPMDLLLFLVKRNEVDIYDIPVATITEQYLEYLLLMEMLDIEIAGEFIAVAAQLLLIKSRMLLPMSDRVEDQNEGEEGKDPRRELARRLAEYRKYRESAEKLRERIDYQSHLFARTWDESTEYVPETVRLDLLSVFDIVTIFKKMLLTARPDEPTIIQRQTLTVGRRMEEIEGLALNAVLGLSFYDIVPARPTKMEVIVTFLAVLELIRRGRIIVEQRSLLGEIRIYPVACAA